MMRIGESRVSQIHTSALLRLRERLAETLSKRPPLMRASGSRAVVARLVPPLMMTACKRA